ncbi:MAG TPA: hypothetical protein VJY54_02080 [Lachnospiraceae bacterium]|nr:hypothetical protein [Lachnospiraceae bacterium]
MGKKKKEHVAFDNMLSTKKSIPFGKANQSFNKMGNQKNSMNNAVSKNFSRKTP